MRVIVIIFSNINNYICPKLFDAQISSDYFNTQSCFTENLRSFQYEDQNINTVLRKILAVHSEKYI
jgi:hypothetical protein